MKLKINKKFAAQYNERRRKEELSKLKSKYGDIGGEDSDEVGSESSVDEEKIFSDTRELDVMKALETGDPRIYDPNYNWYPSSSDEEDSGGAEGSRKRSGVFLRDVERLHLMQKGGKDEANDGLADDDSDGSDADDLMTLKKEFQEAARACKAEDETPLFTLVKSDTTHGVSSDDVVVNEKFKHLSKDELLVEYVRRMSSLAKQPRTEFHFMSDSDFAEAEEEEGDESSSTAGEEDSESNSGDILILKPTSSTEAKSEDQPFANFRWEEPDKDFIKSYPRKIQDSLRQAANSKMSRSEKNRKVRERKRREKDAKLAKVSADINKRIKSEIEEYKRLKKEEAQERIEKIKRTAAVDTLQLDVKDLEEAWDPGKHDRLVQEMFKNEVEDGDEKKPVFSEDEELDKDVVDWDEWTLEAGLQGDGAAFADNGKDESGTEAEEPRDRGGGRRRRRRRRRLAGFRRALERAAGHSSGSGDAGRYKKEDFPDGFDVFLDKVYDLDCEDIIRGHGEGQEDIKCRFKYRTVEPMDYGLSTEEILSAPAKELNAWTSLKKVVQIRSRDEEKRDRKLFSSKRRQMQKSRLLPTVFVPAAGDEEKTKEDVSNSVSSKKRKEERKRKKKKKKNAQKSISAEDASQVYESNVKVKGQQPEESCPAKKRKKNSGRKEIE